MVDNVTGHALQFSGKEAHTGIRYWEVTEYIVCVQGHDPLKEKSKVFKYAKWPSKWLTNESLVWGLIKFKKWEKEMKSLCWFLIDFIFCRLPETAVSGSPSVTWLSRKMTSLWGVSAVAILDCSLNVYACGRQKAFNHASLLCCNLGKPREKKQWMARNGN